MFKALLQHDQVINTSSDFLTQNEYVSEQDSDRISSNSDLTPLSTFLESDDYCANDYSYDLKPVKEIKKYLLPLSIILSTDKDKRDNEIRKAYDVYLNTCNIQRLINHNICNKLLKEYRKICISLQLSNLSKIVYDSRLVTQIGTTKIYLEIIFTGKKQFDNLHITNKEGHFPIEINYMLEEGDCSNNNKVAKDYITTYITTLVTKNNRAIREMYFQGLRQYGTIRYKCSQLNI